MLNVVVFTSDKQIHCIPAFAYLFNKYWSSEQKVTVVGFAEPDRSRWPVNFEFVSLGDMADYPWHKWSNALLDFLTTFPQFDQFVFLLEDYFITRRVDVFGVEILNDLMRRKPQILKIDLCADRLYSAGMTDYDYHDRFDLIKSAPYSPYHMSFWGGLWNRQALLETVKPDCSPHDVEIDGSNHLSSFGDKYLVLGTRQQPLHHITAYKFAEPNRLNLNGLRQSDVTELRAQGLLP